MHPNICICVCVCVCAFHAYTYIIHLSVYVRTGRGYVCVHQCVMVVDRLCAHAFGGLVLRARLKTRNPKPCEPLPVCVDRVRLRRAVVLLGVGVQRGHRRVEHRGRHHVVPGMRRSRPRGAHYGGRARPGLRCGAAGCARRHRRCTRACAHVQALACAVPRV